MDKAAKKGLIHANKAANLKSKAAKAIASDRLSRSTETIPLTFPRAAPSDSGAASFLVHPHGGPTDFHVRLHHPRVPPEQGGEDRVAIRMAYQVCEGCDSIVGGAVVICPNCHSFRFDAARQRVIDQATLLGSREQTSVTSSDLS